MSKSGWAGGMSNQLGVEMVGSKIEVVKGWVVGVNHTIEGVEMEGSRGLGW